MSKYSEKVDLGDGDWGKVGISDTRTDILIGDDSGKHCHLYDNKEIGDVGMIHRGKCAECKDNYSGNSGK